MRTLVTSLRLFHDMTTQCKRSAGCARTAGRWPAGDGGVLKIARRIWEVGVAGNWPSTGGVVKITAAAWTVGFPWWRSGNITRTQNVSEYMLVLALCLVKLANDSRWAEAITCFGENICLFSWDATRTYSNDRIEVTKDCQKTSGDIIKQLYSQRWTPTKQTNRRFRSSRR